MQIKNFFFLDLKSHIFKHGTSKEPERFICSKKNTRFYSKATLISNLLQSRIPENSIMYLFSIFM